MKYIEYKHLNDESHHYSGTGCLLRLGTEDLEEGGNPRQVRDRYDTKPIFSHRG